MRSAIEPGVRQPSERSWNQPSMTPLEASARVTASFPDAVWGSSMVAASGRK